jgi:DNA-binding protein H-NS
MDLTSLSIEELATLRDDAIAMLAEKVSARQKELESEINRIASLNGEAPKSVVKPKYKLNGHEWSGRGSQPAWVREALAGGKSLADIAC